ncbi:F-box/FBD/LRR-repeat protein At4g26340-like [Tripterygium wilfordii]|uniref:F-box/FBD/LRR-repeat protein At4g26340-like n=1 Tax=Tripterygium wilfordii TaxID=458696 RepID=UPI0018F85D76|nr:F-box/FBD/LRR-repeat protein At4g26340-like [Tripterygium wilfordii]
MDLIYTSSNPKRQKIEEEEKVVENEDRITQLPDSLLHHILSLLPTKDAVATCILSTRWQDLWMSVTNLDLKCTVFAKTLRALKVKLSCDLELPETICLPSLTVLHLCYFNFEDEVSIDKLFSGLPVLEELELTHCKWNMFTATTSIPTLKSLTLDFSLDPGDDVYGCLRLNVENLMYFSYTGNLKVDLLLETSSSLVDASIHVGGFVRHDEASSHAANLFNGIRFAKSIKIDNDTVERLWDIVEEEKMIPKFGYLTSLEVDATVTSETSDVLKDFLQNSPILESLVVRKVHGGRWARDSTTQCPMLNLKTCSLLYFSGQAPEVSFLKFVLKWCAVLERIKLFCAKCLSSNPEKLAYINKQLEKALLKVSKSCVIEFL